MSYLGEHHHPIDKTSLDYAEFLIRQLLIHEELNQPLYWHCECAIDRAKYDTHVEYNEAKIKLFIENL